MSTLQNNPLYEKDENGYELTEEDERYSGDSSFYGDLCCYSEPLCDEQSIQMIDFRFNTAQRELSNNFTAYSAFTEGIIHDEITSDDYDDNAELYSLGCIRKGRSKTRYNVLSYF